MSSAAVSIEQGLELSRVRTGPAHELVADVDDERVGDTCCVDPVALVVLNLEGGDAVLADWALALALHGAGLGRTV